MRAPRVDKAESGKRKDYPQMELHHETTQMGRYFNRKVLKELKDGEA